jgi:hypothetical protein
MKSVKIAVIAIAVYVGIVVAFESLIGVLQPASESTLVLTTTDPDGTPHDRVLARVDSGGKLYVSVNHWPRAWYRCALENPEVEATVEGKTTTYTAVPVTGSEHDQVVGEHPHPLAFRFVTGFPPRHIVRLDPR